MIQFDYPIKIELMHPDDPMPEDTDFNCNCGWSFPVCVYTSVNLYTNDKGSLEPVCPRCYGNNGLNAVDHIHALEAIRLMIEGPQQLFYHLKPSGIEHRCMTLSAKAWLSLRRGEISDLIVNARRFIDSQRADECTGKLRPGWLPGPEPLSVPVDMEIGIDPARDVGVELDTMNFTGSSVINDPVSVSQRKHTCGIDGDPGDTVPLDGSCVGCDSEDRV